MESHEVFIDKINEVYIRVDSEMSSSYKRFQIILLFWPQVILSFPFRKRIWDGKIRLFNVMNRQLYYGLLPHLCKFLFLRDYKTKFKHDFKNDLVELNDDYIRTLKLPVKPRQYQIDYQSLPLCQITGHYYCHQPSGKSLIIYILVRYLKRKTLILVPTTSLVSQMYNDFREYGWDAQQLSYNISCEGIKYQNFQ